MPPPDTELRDGPRHQPPAARERWADRIADTLDAPMTALGVIFLLVVLAETVLRPRGATATALVVTGWALWSIFVAEFVVRLVVAPSAARFLRRNWWQVVFLALPFLRFARILSRLRVLRTGRVLSSAVRSTRTASRQLSNRLAWLAVITAIVILSASQVLYQLTPSVSFADTLHATALATVSGAPLDVESGPAKLVELVLILYSVVVFAALAGMLGAFFLERVGEGVATRPERPDRAGLRAPVGRRVRPARPVPRPFLTPGVPPVGTRGVKNGGV